MRNDEVQQVAELFEIDKQDVVEIAVKDGNGEDLGRYMVESGETVGTLIEEIVEDSGLPSKRKYEAYHRGRKLAPSSSVREAGIRPGDSVEVFPSVTTGARTIVSATSGS